MAYHFRNCNLGIVRILMMLLMNRISKYIFVSAAFHVSGPNYRKLQGGIILSQAQLYEGDRVDEYNARGYTWPPLEEEFKPNNSGWRKMFQRRFDQIYYSDDTPGQKYQAYLVAVYSSLIAPSFSEKGWALARAPSALVKELRDSLRKALDEGLITEESMTAFEEIEMPFLPPLFHKNEYQEKLNKKVLDELRPLHEAWCGVELVPEVAYGLRIYRNQSCLLMHTDSPETHVISSILHIDHDENSEPWPLVIEDFDGNTNEVFLESGDMLFYESSKLLHGRPRRFNGEWYSSIFLHYYPKGWDGERLKLDSHYRIPETWFEDFSSPSKSKFSKGGSEFLQMMGTSFVEPFYEDGFSGLKNSIKHNARSGKTDQICVQEETSLTCS